MKFFYVLLLLVLISCHSHSQRLTASHIEIFKNTAVWEVAKYVNKDDSTQIRAIAANYDLNYQSPFNHITLLFWAVSNFKYHAARALLDLGADPNVKDVSGATAVCVAAEMYDSSDLLIQLLQHGGNPNVIADDTLAPLYVTPLIGAAGNSLKNVQTLLSMKVDTNYRSPHGSNALMESFIDQKITITRYLLIDCQAKFDFSIEYENYMLAALREMRFPINSDKHKIKMEVVEYLRSKGIDYSKWPIPEFIQSKYDKEYLEKY